MTLPPAAIFGNPFFLVKARLQAYSPQLDPSQARHHYTGTLNGLSTIVKKEGIRGLWRGWDAAVLRTAMGSTVQLPAYNLAKTYLSNLKESDTFAYNPALLIAGRPNSFLTYLTSSIFSGLCVCAVMQPADTALTRMYNQPVNVLPNGKTVGALYRGPLHCLYLTAKAEGPLAWYKVCSRALRRVEEESKLTSTSFTGHNGSPGSYCAAYGLDAGHERGLLGEKRASTAKRKA